MNPTMKLALQIVSFIGLALSIIPAFLAFAGVLSKDAYLQMMLVGMFLWFGTAIFWIKADHLGE